MEAAYRGDELTLEGAPTLNVERLVDRLVRDPHRVIIGEVDPQPVRDLLGTPRLRPTAVLTATMPTTDPSHIRPRHQPAVWLGNRASEALLHVVAQRVARGEEARSAGRGGGGARSYLP